MAHSTPTTVFSPSRASPGELVTSCSPRRAHSVRGETSPHLSELPHPVMCAHSFVLEPAQGSMCKDHPLCMPGGREGAHASMEQPPGGLDTHDLDFYMRFLAHREFNTIRITFNHGLPTHLLRPWAATHAKLHLLILIKPTQPATCNPLTAWPFCLVDAVLQNAEITPQWGSTYAPELHKQPYIEMFRLVAKAAAKRGIFVVMAAQQFKPGRRLTTHHAMRKRLDSCRGAHGVSELS
jgi:hypothetical protein